MRHLLSGLLTTDLKDRRCRNLLTLLCTHPNALSLVAVDLKFVGLHSHTELFGDTSTESTELIDTNTESTELIDTSTESTELIDTSTESTSSVSS